MPSSASERGYGFIEFLVVMVVLALVVTLVLVLILRKKGEAMTETVGPELSLLAVEVSRISWAHKQAAFLKGKAGSLEAAIREYSSLDPDEILTDPWGRPYLLRCDGQRLSAFTGGRDRRWGTPKADRDNVLLTATVSTGKSHIQPGAPAPEWVNEHATE